MKLQKMLFLIENKMTHEEVESVMKATLKAWERLDPEWELATSRCRKMTLWNAKRL